MTNVKRFHTHPVKLTFHFLGFLAFALSATAADRATEPIESEHGRQPNHLEPVSPNLDEYDRLLEQRLLPKIGDFGTFVFRPSFSGEMAVAIYGTDFTMDTQEPRSFRVTVMRATKSLWNSMPNNNDGRRSKPVRITRADASVDRELAVAIQRAWASMLLRTRYPAKDYHGLDGFTAQFSVFVRGMGQIYGETWSPRHGLPKEFVELGFAVAEYASATPNDRRAIRAKLVKRLRNFERQARNA